MILCYRVTSSVIRRFPMKLLQTVIKRRNLTEATATLRLSPNRTQEVRCGVEGAPLYSVMIPRNVGCDLGGRDLGSTMAKLDLIFYGGRHFGYDKLPQSPCLTLPPEAASLIDSHDGAEKPAALFQDDNMEDSVITLKGTEGEEMWDFTAQGAHVFRKALKDMK